MVTQTDQGGPGRTILDPATLPYPSLSKIALRPS